MARPLTIYEKKPPHFHPEGGGSLDLKPAGSVV